MSEFAPASPVNHGYNCNSHGVFTKARTKKYILYGTLQAINAENVTANIRMSFRCFFVVKLTGSVFLNVNDLIGK